MVVNKFSPGCCCNDCPDCVGSVPDEFDFTTTGLSDITHPNMLWFDDCETCDTLSNSFTVTGSTHVAPSSGTWMDGWYGGGSWPKAADVPSGAVSACVWSVDLGSSTPLGYIYPYCNWRPTMQSGYNCSSQALFTVYSYVLAKFKISATSYKWRLIINYQMNLSCSCAVFGGGPNNTICCQDGDLINSGWFWEHSSSAGTCTLSGGESWSPTVPSFNLSVTCDGTGQTNPDDVLNETLSFSDICSGTLSLSSNPTS